MKSLLMGHIASPHEFPKPYFEKYNASNFKKQGVLFGLWAWRNVLEMDTYFGPVITEFDMSFLDDYDLIFIVGIKAAPSDVYNNPVDGYNRVAWVRKNFPHLKIVLMSDIGAGFYTIRKVDSPYAGAYERIREQIKDADVFLQLCWAYINELKDFFKVDNVYTIEPVDFEEYNHWVSKAGSLSRKRNLIAVTRHNEMSHENLRRMMQTARVVQQVNPTVYFRFFSIMNPADLIPQRYKEYKWTFHELFTDIRPMQSADLFIRDLSECGIFIDNITCSSAGPRFSFTSSILKIPSVFNTGLAEALYPELAIPPVKHITDTWNDMLWAEKIKRLLEDDAWYKEMSELVYRRIWEKCRPEAVKKELFTLLNLS